MPSRWRKVYRRTIQRLVGTVTLGAITHVSTREPAAALTFDDGPSPACTPRLLETLARHQAKATFFMVGEAARRHPDLVHQAAQAGHAIGNHSWSHPSFPMIRSAERRAQLRQCESALAPYSQKLFRPPFGHQSAASQLDVLALGYTVVTWSVVAQDWVEQPTQAMVERLIQQIRPGSVILLHDALYRPAGPGPADREPMLAAVDQVLARLSGAFRFVTLPELLRCGRAERRPWYRSNAEYVRRLEAREAERPQSLPV